MIKEDFNSPKKGMTRHTHQSESKNSDYPFLLNGNVQDPTGDGDFIIENEPSNIKCSSVKPGYVVLKQVYDRIRERIYLFIVNEETGCSEIGYISAKEDFDINEVEELICNCDTYANPEIPLEDIFQEDRCDYTTILSDYCAEEGVCTGCLNFSTKYPILNVEIRHSIIGDEIYWNDGNNPDRFFKLYDVDSYFQNVDDCEGEVTPTCLQCDKLRIFTLFDKPCILPVAVGEGGALRAGVYTVFIAYSDIDGTEVSDYFTGTNLISIFDKNNTILDQTQLDYRTNKSIQIKLNNLDQSFEYYKVVVGVSTGNDPGITYRTYGVFPIDQEDLTISQLASSPDSSASNPESNSNLNVNDLLAVRPFYLSSRLMTSANGYLFLGDLKAMREINLQPIVNLMGSLVKWGSSVAYEDLYEYGESTAKFKTYHRNEAYPLGIRFSFKGGFNTAVFPFIARPPFPEEIDIMPSDNNRLSIEANIDTCGEYERDKVWQFLNTAVNEGAIPCESSAETEEVIVPETHSCTTTTTFETGDGVLSTDIGEPLLTWINNNVTEILASSDPELSEIKDALSDSEYYGDCTPNVNENCDDPVLNSESILAVEVINEKLEEVSIPFDQYDPVPPPTECERLVDPLTNDTVIEAIVGAGSTVWQKTPNTNTSCSSATQLEDYNGAPLLGSYHLVDMGSTVSSADLYDSAIPVSLTDSDFKPFLHKNAVWFKVPFFNNSGRIIAHMSEVICGTIDDNTNNKIRITVFDGCPTLTEKPAYGVIINDVTVPGNPDMFLDLDSADFTGTQLTAYIAVDSPMKSEMEVDLTFTGTSGDGEVSILTSTLPVVFNTDVDTTASDFVTTNSAILTSLNITATVSLNVVTLIMNEDQYDSLTWTQLNPDINVAFSLVSQKHLLQPPCGCFAFYRRIPTLMTVITYDNIIFAKEQIYTYQCTYDKVGVKRCDVAPREQGLFSYCESTLKYPCNKELYDSSELVINTSRIPAEYQAEFEGYYVSGVSGGNYILSPEANFMDKPIRHYKFPDNSISPFMQINSEDFTNSLATNSFICPIGFRIDNDVINGFLDIAVDNELLTQEERDNITGYEIFRGDRATDRSIIAKGLLFDMRSYDDVGRSNQTTYYPNYPLNDSTNQDGLNGLGKTSKTDNFFYTFHSPETHFEKPTLPNELYVDSFQIGVSGNKFAPVRDHVTWVLLGRKARNVAKALATAEIALEIVMQSANLLTMAAAGGISAIVAAIIAAVWIVVLALTIPNRFGKYKYEWLQTFENVGNPFNLAYYGISQGIYKSLILNNVDNSKLRGLELNTYLKEGRKFISNESFNSPTTFFINNYQREDSVLLKFSESHKLSPPSEYVGYDNSMYNIPTDATGILGDYLVRKSASPYGTIKRYVPNQYGSLNSIGWLSTGYCGDLMKNNSCDIIFGGDIFISRFSVKRKFPFFTENAVDLPPNTPFKYTSFFNINTGLKISRGFVDFKTSDENMNSGFFDIPENISEFMLWDGSGWVNDVNQFYIKDNYKFLLFYYGFPYFLVESEFNCNYRYAGIEMKEDFYPNFGDTVEYTQEVNVSISEKNEYKYNSVYSARRHKTAYRLLPVNFSKDLSILQTDLENAVIASNQDNDEVSKLRSPWLNYRPSDFYRFKKAYGSLIDLKGIESEMLWARFSDGYEILNTIDTLAERMTEQTRKTGLGGMFRQRALSFNVTDLGYNGTQHRETISTEFGHYSVDAKRGKVFQLSPGAKGVEEISQSMDKWFKEQLPFKILKKFPNVNVDNPYNGIGISMGWDDRTKRLFLTKRDYIPNSNELQWSEEDDFYIEYTDEKGDRIKQNISLLDEDYFTPAHWTTAYSPLTKMWISYYSFNPFYYITLNDHFKTGMNLLGDEKNGIWSHYPLISSYQVFYGQLFPFIVEYSLPTTGTMSSVQAIEFLLDVKKYYNKFDFSNVFGKGFNKAYIYNDKQNSGKLELNVHNKNKRSELIDYPKYTADSVKILQYQNNDFWSFNYLFNHVKDIKTGLPIWLNDNVDVLKELNNLTFDYRNIRRDEIRGDWFTVRLVQDAESRNKMIFRLPKTTRNFYAR